MGGGLRKPAPVDTYAPPPKTTNATNTEPTDEELDRREALEAQREHEAAARQQAAVAHVVEHLFPYAPVKVQTQKYPPESPHAGQAYLWICVDEAALARRGAGASVVRYPVGVAVDADGNVFVSDTTASDARRITTASIVALATTNRPPAPPAPPRLIHADQHALTIRWNASSDSTVDQYDVQSRAADSVHTPWSALAVVPAVRDVVLDGVACHRPFRFRVRARNPAGWSDWSDDSDAFWTLPGAPATPRPPVIGARSNTYISLFWSPVDAHGAPPVVYTLERRQQKATWLGLYEGTSCSFVASDLTPQTTYVFRLQASNTVGSSPFVETKPLTTSAHGRPEIVELPSDDDRSAACDRWVQCWDPKSEQVFFFNKYTCQRVTDEPKELVEARQQRGVETVDETPDMRFRRTRFRFHRDLRQSLVGVNLSATVAIDVRRALIYEDSLARFKSLTKAEWFAKPKVTFADEEGIDSGGLTKDWYLQLSQRAAVSDRRLFKACDHGQLEIETASSSRTPEFRWLGKLMAKAIFDRQTVDLPLCDAVLKHVLQLPITMADLHDMDPQFHSSLVWMLEHDITDVIDETFSVDANGETVDLKENGRDIPVTNGNKSEYVALVLQWRTAFGVQSQLDALQKGFYDLVPLASLRVFELPELRMLLNGKPTIDVDELRANTVFQGGYSEHAQVVLWLWQALREFSPERRGLFLKFMTGTTTIPLDGFEPPLNITKSDLDPNALPRSHTCFNQIVLPEYRTYDALVAKVTLAIENADGFQLS